MGRHLINMEKVWIHILAPLSLVSTEGHWHWSDTSGNDHCGLWWRRKLNSVQTAQLNCVWSWKQQGCGTAQLWYGRAVKTPLLLPGPGARQPWGKLALRPGPSLASSALLLTHLLCPVPVCPAPAGYLWCFSPAREMKPEVFGGKRKCTLWARGDLTFIDRNQCPYRSVFMEMRTSNPYSLIGPKALSWLVRMEMLWLVGEEVDGDISSSALTEQGEPKSSWTEE